MPLITESNLRAIAQAQTSRMLKSAGALLNENTLLFSEYREYDVFLSHSIKDANIILGIKTLLENQGLKVYVDWIDDPNLDRSNVTPETADKLRRRMKQSKSLIYAHSNNSPHSKWMPWETGYFDGLKGVVAILPIARAANESFSGQEFLGLYPYIDEAATSLFINRGRAPRTTLGTQSTGDYLRFKDWMRQRAGATSMY